MKKLLFTILTFTVSFGAFAKSDVADTTEVVPFERGIGMSRSVFIPKGTVSFGASFSYSTYDVGNAGDADSGFKALFGLINGLIRESVLFLNDAKFINSARIIDKKAYISPYSPLFRKIKNRLMDYWFFEWE